MFKNMNQVQEDLNSETPGYITKLIKYYLGEDSNRIIEALNQINQEEYNVNNDANENENNYE